MPPGPLPRPDGKPESAGRRPDPWGRPAPQGRPDDWNAAADRDRPEARGWDTVLPPVGGARAQDPGRAGVDEATAFLSQWGPPPLRPTESAQPPEWGRPSRAGAGRSADNPAAPPAPDRARPAGPPGALPPVADASPAGAPQLPTAPTEPAAERWIADRLAADRATGVDPADDHFAGYWATDRPARPATDRGGPADEPTSRGQSRPPTGRPGNATDQQAASTMRPPADRTANDPMGWAAGGPDQRTGASGRDATRRSDDRTEDDPMSGWAAGRPNQRTGAAGPGVNRRPDERAGDAAMSGWAAGRPGSEERFAGYWATGGDEDPAAGRGRAEAGQRFAGPRAPVDRTGADERFAGYRDGAVRDGRTDMTGPLDVGAWSREAAGPAGLRGRQRQPEGPGAGGGGDQPPEGGGGTGGQPRRRGFGDRIRTFVRGIGQTFITLGLVLLLLAAYEMWFTDLMNHRTQKDLTTALQNQWDQGDDPTVGAVPAKPGEKVRSMPLGDGFALIYIPDFGTDYVFTVVEGTGLDELNKGPGHYVGTPLPGAVGNVAIAGHRVGKGSPFLDLDKLKAGSAIVIRTKSYWYTYRVVGGAGGNADAVSALGFPGREIVDPSDVGVIAPVPDKPGVTPTRRLLTLTTCHPKFTARQRMVIHAELDGQPFPAGKGTPPSMTGG